MKDCTISLDCEQVTVGAVSSQFWYQLAGPQVDILQVTLGICAGTNVMVRARSCFEVCQYAELNSEVNSDGEDQRQLFTEDEISEDVVLGSRLHAAGFKGVFIAENLATGEVCQLHERAMEVTRQELVTGSLAGGQTPICDNFHRLRWLELPAHEGYCFMNPGVLSVTCVQVPLEPRAMWRQRFRWFKGGHLFLLSPTSVFFQKHDHMTLYQKSLYWICLVANLASLLADPILMALPFLCLVLNTCVYGMDGPLFWTHFVHLIIHFFSAAYYTDLRRVIDALKVRLFMK